MDFSGTNVAMDDASPEEEEGMIKGEGRRGSDGRNGHWSSCISRIFTDELLEDSEGWVESWTGAVPSRATRALLQSWYCAACLMFAWPFTFLNGIAPNFCAEVGTATFNPAPCEDWEL